MCEKLLWLEGVKVGEIEKREAEERKRRRDGL